MIRDLISNISPAYSLTPVVRTADANGSGVDLQGFRSAVVLIQTGVGGITFDGTNKIEYVLQHSDDDSTYTAVAQADVQGVTVTGSGIVRSLVAAHAAASIVEVGYVGGKRYVRAVADFSGTHGTGTLTAATVIRGGASNLPVS